MKRFISIGLMALAMTVIAAQCSTAAQSATSSSNNQAVEAPAKEVVAENCRNVKGIEDTLSIRVPGGRLE